MGERLKAAVANYRAKTKRRPIADAMQSDVDILADAFIASIDEAADAEPITPEWCGSRWLQSSDLRDVKEYCIFDSVCIRFRACVGGWDESEVYVGTTRINHIKTRRQLRQLVKLLRGE